MKKIKYNEVDGVVGFSKTIKMNKRDNCVPVGTDMNGDEYIMSVIVVVPDSNGGFSDSIVKPRFTNQFDGVQIRPKVLMKDTKGYFYRKDSKRVSLTDKSVKKLKHAYHRVRRVW